MKSPEILAPVGDWQMLRAAVHNGADAVYIGMPGFNARGRAATLDLPELKAMIDYAHLYGVRVLLACNILIFERELSEVAQLLSEVIPLGPDALIVQDLGLVNLIRQIAPEQTIHASTQMTVTNSLAIEMTKELGMKRYVLGREVSLQEMQRIKNDLQDSPEIELEVFVHGALCVSYSGQCLTSESLGGRSANRGQCAQSCRLPYTLIVDGKEFPLGDRAYLVSPKDLCSLDEVEELLKIGIDSFKIEGRLKSPAYVASTSRSYREKVDHFLVESAATATNQCSRSPQDLQKIYSRGFFSGWMHGVNHQKLVDGRYGSHFGLEVGKVTAIHDGFLRGATHASHVEVSSTEPICAGDGLLFYNPAQQQRYGGKVYSAEPLPSDKTTSPTTRTYRLQFSRDFDFSEIVPDAAVFINSSPTVEGELSSSFSDRNRLKKIPISFEVTGSVGAPLRIFAQDDRGNRVESTSTALLEPAERAPLNIEKISEELSALGGTVYSMHEISVQLDSPVFLHNKELKNIRRSLCEKLSSARVNIATPKMTLPPEKVRVTERGSSSNPTLLIDRETSSPRLSVLVREVKQIHGLTDLPIDTVYLDFEFGKEYEVAAKIVRDQGKRVAIATTRILKPGELGHLKVIERIQPDAVLVRNLGALQYFKHSGLPLVGDFSLNVSNSITARWFISQGLSVLTPSADLNGEQLSELLEGCSNTANTSSQQISFEVPLHHYMPAFHMEHCVFAAFLSTGTSYKDCGRPCEKHRVEIKDPNGRYHPLKADAECRNTMFNGAPQSALKMFQSLRELGVLRYRLEALFESPEELHKKCKVYTELLAGRQSTEEALAELSRHSLSAAERVGVTDGQLYNIRSYADRKKAFTSLHELPVHVDPGLLHIVSSPQNTAE